MVKKIQISMSNKSFYSLVVFGVLILVCIGVYAYGSSNPVIHGHSAGEIEVDDAFCNKITGHDCGVDNVGESWPAGSYCIFANGACPSGFTRKSGYMRAISLFAGTPSYIKQVTFGSSNIKCHGACGQYGSWTGELNLEICCK